MAAGGQVQFDFDDPSFVERLGRALLARAAELRRQAAKSEPVAAKRYPPPTAAGAGRAERWLASVIAASPDRKQLTRTRFIEKSRELGCSRQNATKIWRRLVTANDAAGAWRTTGRPRKT